MSFQEPTRVVPAQGDEELRMLWRAYKDRSDLGARDRLILTYAPLVKFVAGRMSSALPSHVEDTDLISFGLLGLIGAVERYDPGREVKFETYAVARIKGAIIDELRAQDWVPRSVRARAREIERKSAELKSKLQRAPTDEEMARALGMTVDEFQTCLTQIANSSIVALDEMWAVSTGGESVSLIDTIRDSALNDPAALLDLTERAEILAAAIARLPKQQKTVISLYYYDELSFRAIAEVLRLTESGVSQLHTMAILRLKRWLQEGVAKPWEEPELARRAAQERAWESEAGPLLDAAGATALLGARSRDAISDLARNGNVVALAQPGRPVRYPASQFGPDGRPYPVIALVLTVLRRARLDDWSIATWLVNPQLELNGKTPADWLRAGGDPQQVHIVAERAAAPLER